MVATYVIITNVSVRAAACACSCVCVRVRVTAKALVFVRTNTLPPVVPIAATDFAGVKCASSTRLINDAITAQTRS